MSARYDCADTLAGGKIDAWAVAAATAVQEGQLVVLPTDTVYGIGADAFPRRRSRRCSRPRAGAGTCRPRCSWAACGRRPR